MSVWKFAVCMSILAMALSDENPIENDTKHFQHIDILSLLPSQEKYIFMKEDLQAFLWKLSSAGRESLVINEYADEVLDKINSYSLQSGKDPTSLPDIIDTFEWKILLITYHGEMVLDKGWLQGLSNLKRTGDATLSSDGEVLTLRMPLTYSELLFDYNYRAKFMGLGPSGYIDGRISGAKFTVDIKIDIVTLEATLASLKLDKMGKISLKLKGNILTDWMVNIFISVITTFVKPVLKGIVFDFVNEGTLSIIALYNEYACSITASCF